jgi:hypothetical protein
LFLYTLYRYGNAPPYKPFYKPSSYLAVSGPGSRPLPSIQKIILPPNLSLAPLLLSVFPPIPTVHPLIVYNFSTLSELYPIFFFRFSLSLYLFLLPVVFLFLFFVPFFSFYGDPPLLVHGSFSSFLSSSSSSTFSSPSLSLPLPPPLLSLSPFSPYLSLPLPLPLPLLYFLSSLSPFS